MVWAIVSVQSCVDEMRPSLLDEQGREHNGMNERKNTHEITQKYADEESSRMSQEGGGRK